MPQGVGVNAFETSSLGRRTHHVADRLASHRLSSFTQEEPRQLAVAFAQVPFQRNSKLPAEANPPMSGMMTYAEHTNPIVAVHSIGYKLVPY